MNTSEMETYRLFLSTIWSRRYDIIKIVVPVTVIMLVYVLVMPHSYTSTVSLLPPQKDQNPFAFGALMQGGSSLPMLDIGASLGFGGRPSDIFVEILNSQSVAESLIVHQDLTKFFDIPENRSHRFAIEPLREATEIEANKNGIILVAVTLKTGYFPSSEEVDSVKHFAANIANEYIVWLDRINRDKLVSRARNSRRFIELEIDRMSVELDSSFTQLVEYQQEHESVLIDKQMEAALGGAARIREKLVQLKVELELKKMDFTESSSYIRQLRAQIEELSKQYQAFNTGKGMFDSDYYVPFARFPTIARDLANRLRDVKILEQVILFLSQQYYQDRVQEARDTPTVQVLDEAVPAILRTSPKRALWMLMTVFFSTLCAVLYIMLSEFRKSHTEKAVPEKNI